MYILQKIFSDEAQCKPENIKCCSSEITAAVRKIYERQLFVALKKLP